MGYIWRVHQSVEDVVAEVRRLSGDTVDIEVKAAVGGLPESVTASLCALANLPGGGWLLLGLDKRLGFTPVALSDPHVLRQGLVGKARACEPPVVLSFVDAEVDGLSIVAARVRECDASAKPCRVASTRQAWVRGWDGDYLMSALEQQAFLAQRRQPTFDRQPALGATRGDLDERLVSLWTEAAREQDPYGLGRFVGEELLRRAGILTADNLPTVAGLLALGVHPQQFFPRFVINLAAHTDPSVRAQHVTTLTGPIPVMLDSALAWAREALPRAVAADTDGALRDRWQYPLEAFRELIANALVHRDLDTWSDSVAIEVRRLTDRLVISNPGGLYGISVDRLGHEAVTSARNARLLEICKYARSEDGARVVETLATGIPRVIAALAESGLPAPQFQDAGIRFTVILRSTDATPQTVKLTATERRIAAALAETKSVAELETELALRGPNIRKALRSLAAKGLIRQDGGRGRPTTYVATPPRQ